MKKGTKIAMIIAVFMIVMGTALCVIAFGANGFRFTNFGAYNYQLETYSPEGDITSVEISDTEYDIEVLPSEDGKCTVTCYDSEKIFHSVKVENGALSIKRTDVRVWYERIGIFMFCDIDMTVRVYLPEDEYESIKAKSLSGNISVEGELGFGSADLQSTSGNISFTSSADELKLKSTSGEVNADGFAAKKLSVQTTSGKIGLSDISVESIEVASTSGEIYCSAVTASGKSSYESVSGNVKLDGCDGGEMILKTVSGNIWGTLLSEKDFTVSTVSGNINIPDSVDDAGSCSIKTISGNVKIEY